MSKKIVPLGCYVLAEKTSNNPEKPPVESVVTTPSDSPCENVPSLKRIKILAVGTAPASLDGERPKSPVSVGDVAYVRSYALNNFTIPGDWGLREVFLVSWHDLLAVED